MAGKGPAVLLVLVLTLTGAAGLVLCHESLDEPRRESRARSFQQLVGGLGFGPALDLSDCAFAFDPRLGRECSHQHGPIPGGVYFCPQHACSVLDYPPRRTAEE